MTKLNNLMILAFILGYALLAQGTPIDIEDGLEEAEKVSEDVDLFSSFERGNRVRRGAPYKYYMKQHLEKWANAYPKEKNIVIVWDGASYSTNQYNNGAEEWIYGNRYLIYQWDGPGYFVLKSNGGWDNWAFRGNYKRYGNSLDFS